MKNLALSVSIAALVWAISTSAISQRSRLDEFEQEHISQLHQNGQWTRQAKLTLARALVGEAGFYEHYQRVDRYRARYCDPKKSKCHPNRDWKIIPWVLLKRWDMVRKSGSNLSFVGMVQAYCSPVKPSLRNHRRLAKAKREDDQRELRRIRRRRFLASLTPSGERIPYLMRRYGRGGDPNLYSDGWSKVLSLVERFAQGQVKDPCTRAMHWNYRVASVPKSMRKVDCGQTLNEFMTIRGFDPRD